MDPQIAYVKLQKERQRKDETVQHFAERLLLLSREAYQGVQGDGGAAVVEKQLVQICIDGVNTESIRLKLLRENPDTLDAAVTRAAREQEFRQRVMMRGIE